MSEAELDKALADDLRKMGELIKRAEAIINKAAVSW
jgi:hypothetical protein